MISKADVIVIGSGGLGAATAYYLSKRKGLSVATSMTSDRRRPPVLLGW